MPADHGEYPAALQSPQRLGGVNSNCARANMDLSRATFAAVAGDAALVVLETARGDRLAAAAGGDNSRAYGLFSDSFYIRRVSGIPARLLKVFSGR